MIKVLVIEDETSIRRLLRYDLQKEGYEVDTAENGRIALDMIKGNPYDVLIVDWMLPEVSGIELVSEIRKNGYQSIIMMLTAKNEEEDILDAFDAGVDDYLTKPFSPRVLTARINAHVKRSQYNSVVASTELVYGNTVLDLSARSVSINNSAVEFTKKEFDLLHFLTQNINVVMSRDQILNEIWDFDYDGDTRIVDVHVHKMRSKLEDSTIRIESLRGIGYVAKTE